LDLFSLIRIKLTCDNKTGRSIFCTATIGARLPSRSRAMRRDGLRRMFSLLTWRILTLRSGDIDAAAIYFGSRGRHWLSHEYGSWSRRGRSREYGSRGRHVLCRK